MLCSAAILSITPIARSIQGFVSNTLGREFFSYLVYSVVALGAAVLLYHFIFTLKVRRTAQYIWIFVCAGLYAYFTSRLRANPEEAVHFIEYGILSYFVFSAFSHDIRDRTIYIITPLLVLFIGTADEFIQWLIPRRIWDYRDIALNGLASWFLMIVIWKGIKPRTIRGPVKRTSVHILAGIVTLQLIVFGLCLSNTPDAVNSYTGIIKKASWLQNEEPMTEYGYKHADPEIGAFYSRFTLEELREMDYGRGYSYKGLLPEDISSQKSQEDLLRQYNQTTAPFLYEFLRHILKRNIYLEELAEGGGTEKTIRLSSIVYRENHLLEKYFTQTLKHSGYMWPKPKTMGLKKTAAQWQGEYISETGTIITSFNLKTAWAVILTLVLVTWTSAFLRIKRINPSCRAEEAFRRTGPR